MSPTSSAALSSARAAGDEHRAHTRTASEVTVGVSGSRGAPNGLVLGFGAPPEHGFDASLEALIGTLEAIAARRVA